MFLFKVLMSIKPAVVTSTVIFVTSMNGERDCHSIRSCGKGGLGGKRGKRFKSKGDIDAVEKKGKLC